MSEKRIRERFLVDLDKTAEKFLAGQDIYYDKVLIPYDIFGNIAHHLMLNKIGAISDDEIKPILGALKKIFNKWKHERVVLAPELEDVHMNIEHMVQEEIGSEIGGKMHLGRSRNDQILTDLRLYMRDTIFDIQSEIIGLIEVLIQKAESHTETIYIAYTHTQQAQPITFGHWCMAHVDTLFRDLERLTQTFQRLNMNPLGAAAIAGTSWPIDREYTASLLGFDRIQENTLDVISSRGEFEADLLGNFSSIMTHLGRIAEDIILSSTTEFDYISLSHHFTTGSSIMPHKKNPDVVELIRAKTAIINGNLVKILGILKGIPSGYNRDHQDLKDALFPSMATVKDSITVLAKLIFAMDLNKEKINEAIKNNIFITTTELVDLLIHEWKLPFKAAYTTIANYFKKFSETRQMELQNLKEFINETKGSNDEISLEKIQKALDPMETIKRRKHIGGPAPEEVQRMIADRKDKVKIEKYKILDKANKFTQIYNDLWDLVEKKIKE